MNVVWLALMMRGAESTVKVAAAVATEPPMLVKTARYSAPLAPAAAVKLNVVEVAPKMFRKLPPPLVLICH